MIEIKCLQCKRTLFKTVPLDNKGNRAILAGSELPLSHENGLSFFECPHCSAKNIVKDTRSATGLPAIEIVSAE